MNHELSQNTGGDGMMGWIQPTCSCGWVGIKEYAYNDYQHSNVREQESRHLRSAAKQEGQ